MGFEHRNGVGQWIDEGIFLMAWEFSMMAVVELLFVSVLSRKRQLNGPFAESIKSGTD